MTLPRLTGTLRAYSSISAPSRSKVDGNDAFILQKKQHENALRSERESGRLRFEKLKEYVEDLGKNTNLGMELLKSLKDIVWQLSSEESWSVVDGATVAIFVLFHDKQVVGNAETVELRKLFGTCEKKLADEACRIVRTLAGLLAEDQLAEIISKATGGTDTDTDRSMFGSAIVVNRNEPLVADEFSDMEDEPRQELSLRYDAKAAKRQKALLLSQQRPVEDPKPRVRVRYDFDWLHGEVKKVCAHGDDALSVAQSAHALLCSHRSNDQLQNELFELLGDKFALIGLLLERRQDLVKQKPKEVILKSEIRSRSAFEMKSVSGIGVTIQTDSEKRLQKLMRKEEKKSHRSAKDSHESFRFDPKTMRANREAALVSAKSAPLFSDRSSSNIVIRPKYPHVYDSNADTRQTAGFITGVKIVLPEGFSRTDLKMYEEVNIPATESLPAKVPRRIVKIEEMDELGQIAFESTKTLNLIQSIVYETAYHTNENLLICAPTGAGKTNIAMLCVIRELRQHLVEGVLRKDDFKIVYVAPMKALAAEMVANFGKRLQPLGVKVRELTGDMQLTKAEIKDTQMLVTTPEKWDVVTRKSTGDVGLSQLVRLLIIDEVHLLHGDRGPVLEALVARTLRQVESTQSMIRIVGLSATLPNYLDVADFLRVNPFEGLFYFDGRFRPVPLRQTFIGVKALSSLQQMQDMDAVCYDKVAIHVRNGHQVMVFVHARNGTVRTANVMYDLCKSKGESSLFQADRQLNMASALKMMERSRNKQLKELFPNGFAFHHAGMLRSDRSMVEKLFSEGYVKVLVCTATLAWGVNLPAHAVIIKGTEIYDAKHGSFVDLGILDVLQIFGRAGRPQYDTSGHGTIITSHDKLSHYLSLLTCQYPIESCFVQSLADNINAEVALGTVANVDEAVEWLSYTYLFRRMAQNPHVYGIKPEVLKIDPVLVTHRRELVLSAVKTLNKAMMVRHDERTGYLFSTDLGRTASHFYIKYNTVEKINEMLGAFMGEDKIVALVSQAEEFDQLKVRDDELDELDQHARQDCHLPVMGGSENTYGKVNILLQSHVSRARVDSFSLVSDQAYVVQNAIRIVRALFEIVLRRNWPLMAARLLTLSKVLELRIWEHEHPLHQFGIVPYETVTKLESRRLTVHRLKEMEASEIGQMLQFPKMGRTVKQCVDELPSLHLEASIHPITRTIIRVHLKATPDFTWNDKVHGRTSEMFWIWVEDPDNNLIYHSEHFLVSKKQVLKMETQTLVFTIPVFEPIPAQYIVRADSERWLGSANQCAISFERLILPEHHPPHTELLDLDPLPTTVLGDKRLEALYPFTHFNAIQTQVFHVLYHTDHNVLLGAPTGSGKTITAEIAMFRVLREYPQSKVVYIAPLKALVRERIEDWKDRLQRRLNINVVEMTGDVTPDARAIEASDVIVTTPEKWDGISRSWQTRSYVKKVSLIVIDEIHLLGEDRGPILEIIVSRTNFIASHTSRKLRIIGLSTALANARDLADWLGIGNVGLYNFRPSVRPVPMDVHIQGFAGKHYCPRMASMNKPTFQAIQLHSPKKPVLIFVSSRRQTRLTALDLISFLAGEDDPKQWVHMPQGEMDSILFAMKDTTLQLTLDFGIGIHHAGLHERDRKTVEELFVNQKIQVLVATATLAWGVNFPAHLVIVKGTEYYDGKARRYVDFPITDVLQMIGRAGRPQFDDHGVAVVLVHDMKKQFYKKFLYEPFPVESSLTKVFPDHLNAEVVGGTINSKQDALDYITWTYFFRRLLQNPTYYQLDTTAAQDVNVFLSSLVETSVNALQESCCVEVDDDNRTLLCTTTGRIASYYYLSHRSVKMFKEKLARDSALEQLLEYMCNVQEYAELPVRHNEDAINSDLAKLCLIPVNAFSYDSPHTKAHLLLQAHFGRVHMSTDYVTDLKSVLDQSLRILQAMVDMCADQGWLSTTIRAINLMQMVVQARWIHDSMLLTLPHIERHHLYVFSEMKCESLPVLANACGDYERLALNLRAEFDEDRIDQVYQVLSRYPVVNVEICIKGQWDLGKTSVQGERKVATEPLVGATRDSSWIKVHADQQYILNIGMRCLNDNKRKDSRAYAPKFPKSKDEGWFLLLGDVETGELLAVKRVTLFRNRTNCQLMFYTPERTGRVAYTLYIFSDCYFGWDQQYDVFLNVVPRSIYVKSDGKDML